MPASVHQARLDNVRMTDRTLEAASRCMFWLLVGVTAWFAWTPAGPDDGGEAIFLWDKADHFLAFGSLAFWIGQAYRSLPMAQAAAWLAGYGALIEAIQTQIPGRFGSLHDWLADGVGIAGGLLAHGLLRRTRSRWRAG